MSWRGVCLGLVGVVLAGPVAAVGARAESRALIEEFLTTEPVYVQPRGETELSSSFDYRRPAGDWRIPVLVEYGITDRLEAEIEAVYLSLPGEGSRDRGPGDLELGLHYAIRPDVETVALTLGVNVGLPMGDETRGLGSGKTVVELMGIAGMKLGFAELHVAGVLEVGEEAEPELNAAVVYPRSDLRFTLETNVLRGDGPGEVRGASADPAVGSGEQDLRVVMTPGLFHCPRPGIEYGIGLAIGLSRVAPDWGVVSRLTVEF
jgi:hypothetical protein